MKKAGKPIIGITTDTNMGQETSHKHFRGETTYWLKRQYVDAVVKSGGLPMLLPPLAPAKRADQYLDVIDGLMVTGGWFDIDPNIYGEKPLPMVTRLQPERTQMEIRLIKKAVERAMPVLGICGGSQAMNIAFGGNLYQDLKTQLGRKKLKHEQSPIPANEASHEVYLTRGSLLRKVVGCERLSINSTHHQAIKETGKGVVVCGAADDCVVEAIELPEVESFILGVQWHPEQLFDKDEASRKLFKRFLKECG